MAARFSTGTPLETSRAQSPDMVQSLPSYPFNLSSRNTPGTSTPTSYRASAFHLPAVGTQKYFKSRRIGPEGIEKPWTEQKDPKKKWHTIFPLIGMGLGVALVALECWQGLSTVINYPYCPVYEDDFSSGTLDPKIWTKEVEAGGFGNGQFEMTTNTDENVFIKDGELWIKPTLQDEKLITTNNVVDLTKQGICTSNMWTNCHAVTNVTNGTIINPVKSARINTKKGASIQYGRVEVVATLPAGDWLWPAIWMLPVKETYGQWPASGEIDIVESRGNNYTYPLGGNNFVSSALHWGPTSAMDAWYRTFAKKLALHTTFAAKAHTFGLEWSEKYLFTYIDGRLLEALYVPFTSPLWPQGHFEASTQNGTRIVDPWSQTGKPSTPFDQKFYLILNVAVGSSNAWFQDGLSGKPWVDASPTAARDFWNARDQWYPTWKQNGQMRVKSVKIWQQGGYQGCKGTNRRR